jgi:hypothetical protein
MNKIIDIINTTPPLKKWSERTLNENRMKVIHKIVKILKWAAGGELKRLIFSLMRVKKYRFSKLTRESRALNKIIPHINERVRQKHKHCFLLAFRQSNFSSEEVQYLGLKFSSLLWNSCLNTQERNVGGRKGFHEYLVPKIDTFLELNSEIAANRTSLKVIKPPIKRKKNGVVIKQKNQRITENARYLNSSVSQLQKKFNEEIADEFDETNNQYPSIDSFYKLKNNLYKLPKRKSDMCDYCVLGNILKRKINEFIRLYYNELYQEVFDLPLYLREFSRGLPQTYFPTHLLSEMNQQYIDEILNIEPNADIPINDQMDQDDYEQADRSQEIATFGNDIFEMEMNIDLDEEDSDDECDTSEPNPTNVTKENVFKQLKTLSQIEFHKRIAKIQREAYTKMINESPDFYLDCLVIEMDFKQKITYGNISKISI